jgi:hypothetical protein
MPRRTDDDIVREALALVAPLLAPTPAQRAALRVRMLADINKLQRLAQDETPARAGVFKRELADALEAMRKARREYGSAHWRSWQRERATRFLAKMDAEIAWLVEQHGRIIVRRSGGLARDPIAKAAVEYAADLLGRQHRKVTAEGAWHQLSRLYYQAATDRHKDTWRYVRRYIAPRPSLRAILEAYRARQRA